MRRKKGKGRRKATRQGAVFTQAGKNACQTTPRTESPRCPMSKTENAYGMAAIRNSELMLSQVIKGMCKRAPLTFEYRNWKNTLLRRPPHERGGGFRPRLLSSRNWLPFCFTVCYFELIGNKIYSALLSSMGGEVEGSRHQYGNENI